jgi:3-hydroxyacyl-CoA dehydrogenase
LPERLRHRFCGTHFFNPPRYMHLLELIPHAGTDPDVLDRLEAFFTSRLGKGVIRAKDTPSFIGNRIGVFSMLAVMHHTERLGLPLDLVDKLTGAGIGRTDGRSGPHPGRALPVWDDRRALIVDALSRGTTRKCGRRMQVMTGGWE